MVDISIIVPIYNSAKYLDKCIYSLVNQTKKELEFILINDGSTDDSEKIIKSYKDKRIKYFKYENRGIGYTRNFGINKASGKYIMFVDSDDYLELNACEYAYNKAINESSDLVVFDFYNEKSAKERENIKKFDNSSLKDNPSLINIINTSPWNKLYLSDLIKNIKFEESLKYEDAPFVLKAVDNAKNITYLDEALYNYVIHEESETTIRDERVFDILKIIDIIRDYFKERYYVKEEIDKYTVRLLTNYTIQQRNQVNKETSSRFVDEAFKYLKENVPDYKNNKYYKSRSFLKKSIEKNKFLTKLYCNIYRLTH